MTRDTLQDDFKMQAKGHVKLELYDKKGEVFLTKEKHNLVVFTANEIVGETFADPARTVKANQTDKGDSDLAANTEGTFTFNLTQQREEIKNFTVDLGSTNTNKDIVVTDGTAIVFELLSVNLAGTDLVVDEDVFIKDPDAGTIAFAVAPQGSLKVNFRQQKNAYVEIIPGSEVITVGGTAFTHGKTPSDANSKYAIDYKLGKVFFETAKANVQVDYKFKVRYSLGFMGLGSKPVGHPDYKPVTYSTLDKLRQFMDGEFAGTRQLVQYPAPVGQGDPEVEVYPTVAMAKKEFKDTITGDGTATVFALTSAAGKPVTDIVSVKDVTDSTNPVDVTSTVTIKDANAGTVQFGPAPTTDHQYEVDYKVRDNVDYTIFTMSQGPVLELDSVVHEDLNSKLTSLKIVNKGLVPGQGDVWIVNASKGIIQFSTAPSVGLGVDTPGQLTFYYRVNSGTTVQFVADFPKGVPGPVLTDNSETLAMTTGQTTYSLQYPISKGTDGKFIVKSIKKGATTLTEGPDFDISQDGTQIVVKVGVVTGDNISITYQFLKDSHDIYQVAMFTEQTDGNMFNISGIGPVTKDKNTGMRITWTVTF